MTDLLLTALAAFAGTFGDGIGTYFCCLSETCGWYEKVKDTGNEAARG